MLLSIYLFLFCICVRKHIISPSDMFLLFFYYFNGSMSMERKVPNLSNSQIPLFLNNLHLLSFSYSNTWNRYNCFWVLGIKLMYSTSEPHSTLSQIFSQLLAWVSYTSCHLAEYFLCSEVEWGKRGEDRVWPQNSDLKAGVNIYLIPTAWPHALAFTFTWETWFKNVFQLFSGNENIRLVSCPQNYVSDLCTEDPLPHVGKCPLRLEISLTLVTMSF
jgi:hypothetical protein